ncbi:putative glycolipid-binding domain-containing protein [Ruegeria marina]|uniref:Glycolipid-binding n=1 Tax=Ruegeria marina TaxID=639004 RepID=A0A1G7AHC4_9RHOB|nr:putative glycolipid-binding domain-containing protein [Ruegeria marina]SDE13455.1 hypothetical protein SAMN04488239_11498 [Ruegeria marina]
MTDKRQIATAHWRRLDCEGSDRCTLWQAEQGLMLLGHAHWRSDDEDTVLSYDLRCAPDGQSLSADIAGEQGGRRIELRLHRTGEGWLLNDVLQPETGDCTDLDLSFTPATNLLPIRRLSDAANDELRICAAWLQPDLDCVSRLDQIYTRLADNRVRCASRGYGADLEVHGSGFVTGYPGHWHGWVDDG